MEEATGKKDLSHGATQVIRRSSSRSSNPDVEATGKKDLAHGATEVIRRSSSRSSNADVEEEAGRKELAHSATEFIRRNSNTDVDGLLRATVGRQVKELESKKTVAREHLLAYVREERERLAACLHFPLMTMYFVVFACVVIAHEDMSNVAAMEGKLRRLATGVGYEGIPSGTGTLIGHKDIDDIDTIVDVWNYIEGGILERFLPVLGSGGSHPHDINRVERVSRLIGGMQLQQQRRRELACDQAYPEMGPKARANNRNPLLEGIQCHPWNQYSSECISRGSGLEGFCPDPPPSDDQQSAARRLSGLAAQWGQGRRLWGASHAQKVRSPPFKEGLYTVILHQHEGFWAGKAKTEQLRQLDWLDKATAWFGIKAFMLNPDLAVYAHLVINVWFSPSGEVIPQLHVTCFSAEPYDDMAMLAGDAIFLALWLHMLGRCVGGLLHALFFRRVKEYLTTFWTWTEWMSMLGGLIVSVGWFLFLRSLGTVKDLGMEVALNQPHRKDGYQFASVEQEAAYTAGTARLHAEVADLTGFLQSYRIFVSWYTIFIIVRFFEAFGAQPRLAIVSNTLERAFVDFAHFLVVLSCVFLSFAVAGILLFGHRTIEFSELTIAVHHCFLIMLGDFDYELLASEHQVTAAVWFFMYSLSVSIIMLNMALAIIMDVYTEVCADSGGSDTIWVQAGKITSSFWHRRDWCSLRQVEDMVCELSDDEISQDALMEAIPGMPPVQAEELIDKVEEREAREESKGLSLSDATRMTVEIKTEVDAVAGRLEDLLSQEEDARAALDDFTREYRIDPDNGKQRRIRFVPFSEDKDHRLHIIEKRLLQMKEQLTETMRATVGGAKEMRHTVTVLENLAASAEQSRDMVGQASKK